VYKIEKESKTHEIIDAIKQVRGFCGEFERRINEKCYQNINAKKQHYALPYGKFLVFWCSTIRFHTTSRTAATKVTPKTARKAKGTQHPVARPILRWRPERVSGMPVLRDMRPFIPEIPIARFHENEKPCFPPIVLSFLLHRTITVLFEANRCNHHRLDRAFVVPHSVAKSRCFYVNDCKVFHHLSPRERCAVLHISILSDTPTFTGRQPGADWRYGAIPCSAVPFPSSPYSLLGIYEEHLLSMSDTEFPLPQL
jgi:hypothetical protein